MNGDGDSLLRALHAADAASPPPPGDAITPTRLRLRLQRQRLRVVLTSAAAVLVGVSLWTYSPPPGTASADAPLAGAGLHAEVRSLLARADRLLEGLAAPLVAEPAWAPASEMLRFELAAARAHGLDLASKIKMDPTRVENR